uniref:Regulator of G protein signaling 2 n=1 Tax=Sphenodon punctatus TaxID=8508 RepID=A0A8D0GTJ6_SPHPU
MQSAMFLALQHNCGKMEKTCSNCPSSEEEKGKMKRTIIKDWKTRLSYFLQNSSASAKTKGNKKGKQKTSFRPSPEEAQLWSEAFDELLANKYGLAAFRAFLKSEFCEENIDFWLACEDFKNTKSPQKLTSKAKKIYNDFIEKEAPKENLFCQQPAYKQPWCMRHSAVIRNGKNSRLHIGNGCFTQRDSCHKQDSYP